MSARKRPSNWLGVPPSSNGSKKRFRTPIGLSLPPSSHVPPSSHAPPSNQSSGSFSTASAQTTQPSKPPHKKTKAAGYAVLSTLKCSMKLLKKGCGLFEPLQSVADDLLGVLDSIEARDPDLVEMASELPKWVLILSSYLSAHSPKSDDDVSSRLAQQIASDLKEQVEDMKEKEKLGTFKRWLDHGGESEELRKRYRDIEASFCKLRTSAALNTWQLVEDQLQESRLDKMSPSRNARYNSGFARKVKRNACLKNTRATVLEDSHRWIYGTGHAKIYWLNGMAGTGKTTIAYTVCSELEQNGQLGASFFCSRSASDCQGVDHILPTIAYQLAQQFYPFRSALCQTLGTHSDIAQRDLGVQFTSLIEEPLLKAKEMLPGGLVIVIDAMDECLDPEAIKLILGLLLEAVAKLPVRFFLTSRPEPSILNTILNRDPESRSILHLHNVEWQLVNNDIETYLTVSLANTNTLTQAQVEQLAERAGALFIYAATVVRYILSAQAGTNRQARLMAVLNGDTRGKATNKDREINILYTTILDEVSKTDLEPLEQSEVELIKNILWVVATVREPVTISTLAGLLLVGVEDVSAALEPLRSVLNVIEGSNIVSPLHASFPEFILNPDRSRQWSCRGDEYHMIMATRCFSTMRNQLRFNICNLETSLLLDKEVPNLQDRVTKHISSELSYACKYWSEHLRRSAACGELLRPLEDFLQDQLLFWMEGLNLTQEISGAARALNEAQEWLLGLSGASESTGLIQDAIQFVDIFASCPVYQSTPHIYISCLPLAPQKSRLWDLYRARTSGLLWLNGNAMDQLYGRTPAVPPYNFAGTSSSSRQINHWWQNSSCTKSVVRGHTDMITSVAFSPDGTQIMSASWDKTARVWSSCDGIQLADPFKGHTGVVTSVAYSPNGARIASGSGDHTVRVWGSRDGALLGAPFIGHTGTVTSVAFSPDGSRIVSASWDKTIRLWGSYDGALLAGPWIGHTDVITCVGFSPDGTLIVSGSWDKTVRVWCMYGDKMFVGSLEGHTGIVTSVAFSSDGTRIVSGSWDKTIRIWDAIKGVTSTGPLTGHTGVVTSVVFSPDSAQVASGSRDRTVRIWNSYDGTLLFNLFKGHTDAITSISFSPDGTRIVSGACDRSIRVWNSNGKNLLADCFKKYISANEDTRSTPGGSHTSPPRHLFDQCQILRDDCAPLERRDHEPWFVDDDGWIRDSSRNLLFWLPKELRHIVPSQSTGVVIQDSSLLARFDNVFAGSDWHKCYNSAGTMVTG